MQLDAETSPDLVPLGRSGILVPPVGVGTWQWGDPIWWQYGGRYGEAEVQAAYEAAVAGGARLFDSAEIYGTGTSERLLGTLCREDESVVVATKFFPFPWRLRSADLIKALQASVRRLGGRRVDLYQIHWPLPPVPVERWMDSLAKAVDLGLTRSVGVSNYNWRQTTRAASALERHGVFLATNQIRYSLLDRSPEHNGTLAACRDHEVTVIAYAPLAMGMLSGKYNESTPPPGLRRYRFRRSRLRAMAPLVEAVQRIAEANGRTTSQVALNWIVCKGAIPIPGAKNALQAQENCGALGWRLTNDEIEELDEVSGRVA
jgi:aryl-alcohol dehydrogenase-like predicted oxidoreductase